MAKIVIVAVPEFNTEDGGTARIAEICEEKEGKGVFVRLQSWSEKHDHKLIDQFEVKKVRVTIETIEE